MIDHNILYQCSTQRERKQPQSHKEMRREKINVCANVRHSRRTISRKERKEKSTCSMLMVLHSFYVYVREVVSSSIVKIKYLLKYIAYMCFECTLLHRRAPTRYAFAILSLFFFFAYQIRNTEKRKRRLMNRTPKRYHYNSY